MCFKRNEVKFDHLECYEKTMHSYIEMMIKNNLKLCMTQSKLEFRNANCILTT